MCHLNAHGLVYPASRIYWWNLVDVIPRRIPFRLLPCCFALAYFQWYFQWLWWFCKASDIISTTPIFTGITTDPSLGLIFTGETLIVFVHTGRLSCWSPCCRRRSYLALCIGSLAVKARWPWDVYCWPRPNWIRIACWCWIILHFRSFWRWCRVLSCLKCVILLATATQEELTEYHDQRKRSNFRRTTPTQHTWHHQLR